MFCVMNLFVKEDIQNESAREGGYTVRILFVKEDMDETEKCADRCKGYRAV